jgi:hypothetical protein
MTTEAFLVMDVQNALFTSMCGSSGSSMFSSGT